MFDLVVIETLLITAALGAVKMWSLKTIRETRGGAASTVARAVVVAV
jgi:hypothetical protein